MCKCYFVLDASQTLTCTNIQTPAEIIWNSRFENIKWRGFCDPGAFRIEDID